MKLLTIVTSVVVLFVAAPVYAEWGTAVQQQSYEKLEKDVLKSAGKASDASCDAPKAYSFLEQRKSNSRVVITPVANVTAGLNADFACRLKSFLQAAESAGYRPTIISGYRSSEYQAVLRACYKGTTIVYKGKSYNCPSGRRGGLAAAPGRSRHNYGLAADVDDRSGQQRAWLRWAHQNSERFGIINPPSIRSRDGHHFQLKKGIPVDVGDESYGGYEEVFPEEQFIFEDTYGDVDTSIIEALFNGGTNGGGSGGGGSSGSSGGDASTQDIISDVTTYNGADEDNTGILSNLYTDIFGSGDSTADSGVLSGNENIGTTQTENGTASAGTENQKACGEVELFGIALFNTCNNTQTNQMYVSVDTVGGSGTQQAYYNGTPTQPTAVYQDVDASATKLNSLLSQLYHTPDDSQYGGYQYYDTETETYVTAQRDVGRYDYYSPGNSEQESETGAVDVAAIAGGAQSALRFVFYNTFAPFIYGGLPRTILFFAK